MQEEDSWCDTDGKDYERPTESINLLYDVNNLHPSTAHLSNTVRVGS